LPKPFGTHAIAIVSSRVGRHYAKVSYLIWWSTNIFLKSKCTFSATCSFFSTVPNFSSHMFCSSVHFFPTAPTFPSHVFCSCFFRQHQNFPFTLCSAVLFFRRHQNFPFMCSAVPFFPTAQIFHSRVLQFLFFRRHKFSIHVYCNSIFF